MSAYNVLPTLFPHGGPFPVKTERVSTHQTPQFDFSFFTRDPRTMNFTNVSLGRNKDMQRNEGTTKRTRKFREGKKRTEDVIRSKE